MDNQVTTAIVVRIFYTPWSLQYICVLALYDCICQIYSGLSWRIRQRVNIVLRRFLHNPGNIATEESPKPGQCPILISNDFKGSL